MRMTKIAIAMASGLAVMLSSCVVDPGVYGASVSYSSPSFSTTVSWTNASYDANGFPIYGYYYGRPVYGYTAAGAAIFTIAALTALCYVPDWGPAPWYHGHWHYPPHIHRVPAPPRYDHGHAPHHRPSGGMNAPIHKNPSSVLGKPKPAPNNHRPQVGGHHATNHRPNNVINHRPQNNRPQVGGHHATNHRPNNAINHRPTNNRPQFGGNNAINKRPNANVARPQNHRPNNIVNQRPNTNSGQNKIINSRPQVNRPATKNISRPSVSRPATSVSRPSVSGNRPAAARRTSGGNRGAARHR